MIFQTGFLSVAYQKQVWYLCSGGVLFVALPMRQDLLSFHSLETASVDSVAWSLGLVTHEMPLMAFSSSVMSSRSDQGPPCYRYGSKQYHMRLSLAFGGGPGSLAGHFSGGEG